MDPEIPYHMIALYMALNGLISCWNAYATGKNWIYTRQAGGFAHLVTWAGYLMTIAGFSWCLLMAEALIAYYYHWYGFDYRALTAMINFGFLLIGPVIVLAGIPIWLDSVANAVRQRSFSGTMLAGYNTYAQIHNTIEVFSSLGPALDNVTDFFRSSGSSSSDSDSDSDSSSGVLGVLVLVLVLVAIAGGIVLATAIVSRVARNEVSVFANELSNRRRRG
jgi:hypothetical protein